MIWSIAWWRCHHNYFITPKYQPAYGLWQGIKPIENSAIEAMKSYLLIAVQWVQ